MKATSLAVKAERAGNHSNGAGHASETVRKLALDIVHISERNTRQPTDKEVTASGLVQSLKEKGQTTPAIARPFPGKPGHYELGAGARRRVGLPLAGYATIDTIVRQYDDEAFEELILVENLQREDPSPQGEAQLLERLTARGISTAEQISAHLGKPKHWVIRRLQLLKVIPPLRKSWERPGNGRGDINHFTVEMMELVGSLPDDVQKGLIEDWNFTRCSSRKELSHYIANNVTCDLGAAPFDLNDERFFVPGCGPGCASDSSKQGALFDFESGGGKKKAKECGRCLNAECFGKRLALWRAAEVAKLTEKAGVEALPFVSRDYCTDEITVGNETVKATHCYNAKEGNKAPEDATKVILVSRTGSMQLGYIPKQEHGGNGAAKKLASPAQKAGMKRDALQARRWKIVHEKLLAALAKSTEAEVQGHDIYDLVTVFGLPYHRQPARGKQTWWTILDAVEKDGYPLHGDHSPSANIKRDKSRLAALWSGLKEVLKTQLGGWYQVGQLLEVVPDMERVAALIGFDLKAAKLDADKEIPPPKTWGPVDPHTLKPVDGSAAKTTTKPKAVEQKEAKGAKKTAKNSKGAKKKEGKRD